MSELPYTSASPEPSGTKAAAQGVKSFVFIDPKLLQVQTVRIHTSEGTIWATPNGGALRTQVGKRVRWEAEQPFTISFVQLGGTSEPLAAQTARFDGKTFSVEQDMRSGEAAPFYEYSIRLNELTLDPIVIVDKT
jgi:hypothetical protein